MNFILAFLVLLSYPTGNKQHKKEPQVYLYNHNGKVLTELNNIMIPNVGNENFQLLVSSPFELQYASVDSEAVALCLVPKKPVEEASKAFRGVTHYARWYTVQWTTELKIGSKLHTIYLTARSGEIYRKTFTINVEGNEKDEKPRRENR